MKILGQMVFTQCFSLVELVDSTNAFDILVCTRGARGYDPKIKCHPKLPLYILTMPPAGAGSHLSGLRYLWF